VTASRLRTRSDHLLRVYEVEGGGTDWVVACDRAHAYAILCAHYGHDVAEDCLETPEEYQAALREMPPWEALTLLRDVEEQDGPRATMPAALWAMRNGAGFLATTEY